MKNVVTDTIAVIAIICAVTTFIVGCGSDAADQIPTTLEADPKTGEVSVKGEKGDKGDKGDVGPAGPAGKDGVNGADGRDGATGPAGKDGLDGEDADEVSSGVWKDLVTGKTWTYIQGRYTFDEAAGRCAPWRVPTPDEALAAVRHSIAKAFTITNPIALDYVMTSEASGATNAVTIIFASTDERQVAARYYPPQANSGRVFCIKPE